MCDARYNFSMVDVGSKGRQSDGGVFKNSNFYERLSNEVLNLLPPSPLYPTGASVSQVCLTDAAFSLERHGCAPLREQERALFRWLKTCLITDLAEAAERLKTLSELWLHGGLHGLLHRVWKSPMAR